MAGGLEVGRERESGREGERERGREGERGDALRTSGRSSSTRTKIEEPPSTGRLVDSDVT
jgi:hypothetical protein